MNATDQGDLDPRTPERPPARPDEPAPVRLRCLSGGAVPDDLRRDAQRLDKLTDRMIEALPSVLATCVLSPMTPELGQKLSRLCVLHEVAEADLGHVVRVARWLLREASAANLDKADLEADIRALWEAPRGLMDVLSREYEPIKRELRKQLLQDALTRHGHVLVDLDWRIDVVTADRHAPRLSSPVALVTLSYRDAESTGRLTLQLLPDQLARLEQVFGALAQRTAQS